MAKVTAALVKQLREMTDAPMTECKKALVEADGDLDKAVDVLRTMGVAKAVKRAGRSTNEGTIGCYVSPDGQIGALLELTCETDFVGGNAKFKGFATRLAQAVAEGEPADVEALKALPLEDSTVGDQLTEMIHVIGENMKIGRFVRISAEKGGLVSYVHHDGKHADIVEFSFEKPETFGAAAFQNFGHDVAMQVIAMNPISAKREDVPADVIEHETSIYRAQAQESGRPERFWDNIVEGRLKKFYAEQVLTEQAFVKDDSLTVGQLAKNVSVELDDDIEIVRFARINFGE